MCASVPSSANNPTVSIQNRHIPYPTLLTGYCTRPGKRTPLPEAEIGLGAGQAVGSELQQKAGPGVLGGTDGREAWGQQAGGMASGELLEVT